MSARFRHHHFFLLAICAAWFSSATVHARQSFFHVESCLGNVSASHDAASPPIPVLKSPVDLFRELLAMSPEKRQQELMKRPPAVRDRITVKLKEYASMKPEDRELRLRMTQVRWYFLTCINLPASQRAGQLAPLTEADRSLVNDRLAQWDRLPGAEQKEILQYEKTMEQFAGQNLEGAAATNKIIKAVNVENRPAALQNLDDFLKLPVAQRLQICSSFQQFFELSEGEKQKTLEALPAAERGTTSGSLQTLLQLSNEQRSQYINALKKFSAMSAAERGEFLRNAERWQQLSSVERQAWRTLVTRLATQPPLPPGLVTPPLPPNVPIANNAP